VIALIGAFVYAELARLRPDVGGQYAYLRDAYHPIVAFLYGWTLLLVVQTGGMAGSAIIFGRYTRELTGWAMPEQAIAAIALGILTLVNCFGVRAGSNVQSALMITKLAAIGMLIVVGLFFATRATSIASAALPNGTGGIAGFGAAMVPVLFAYGGWQTASFVSGRCATPAGICRADLIGGRRDRVVPGGDARLPACAWRGRTGGDVDAGVDGAEVGAGRARRQAYRARHRDLTVGFQSERAHGAAGVFRDGATVFSAVAAGSALRVPALPLCFKACGPP
jgi:hypothetical protein